MIQSNLIVRRNTIEEAAEGEVGGEGAEAEGGEEEESYKVSSSVLNSLLKSDVVKILTHGSYLNSPV